MAANVNLGILIGAKDNASKTIDGVSRSVGALDKSASAGALGGLTKLTNVLRTGLLAAATATVAGIGALAAGITKTTMEAGDMEQKIADVAAVLGLAKDETAPLKALIQDLGLDPKLKVSATEAASAIEMLARNGLSMDQILSGAARSTVLLANSTGVDLSSAADIATDAMAIFKIEAKDMEKAVNGLVGVTNSSKFTMNDYALALGTGAKGAAAANVSFDQFNQMLVATASNFTSGMTAGTGLTAMMLGLSPQTEKAKDIMKELGIITADGKNRFFDMNGEMRSNAEIAEVMRETLGTLNTEQRLTAVDALFGRDAMAAVNGMIATTTDQWGKYATALANTDAEESAATRMDTMRGSLEILSGVWETLRLQIGDKFVPVFRLMIDTMTEFLAANGPQLVAWAGQLAQWLESLVTNALPPFIEKLKGLYDIVSSSAPTWDKFKAVLATLFSKDVLDPTFRFIEGMGRIGGLVSQVLQGYVPLSNVLLDGWGKLAPLIETVTAKLQEWADVVVAYIVQQLPTWMNNLANWGRAAWQWIVDATAPALAKLGEWGTALVGYIVAQLPTWRAQLATWATAAWQWLVDATPVAAEKLAAWGTALLTYIQDQLPSWTLRLTGWAQAAWQWIVNITPTALGKLGEWATALFEYLAGQLPIWNAKLAAWAASASQWIINATPAALNKLTEWAAALFAYIQDQLPTWILRLAEWARTAWQWVVDATPVVLAELKELATGLLAYLQEQLPTWRAKLAAWGTAAWQWLVDVTPTALAQLGAWTTALVAYLQEQLPGWILRLAEWARTAWQWIVDATPVVLEKLGEWAAALVAYVQEQLPGWAAQFVAWTKAAWQWIVDAAPTALEKLTALATDLVAYVQEQSPTWAAQFVAWRKAAWQWLVDATPLALAKLGEWTTAIMAGIAEQLPTFIANMYKWQTQLWQWIGDAIPKAIAGLSDFIESITGWSDTDATPRLGETARGWFGALIDWIANDLIPAVGPELVPLGTAMLGALGSISLELSAFALKLATGIVTSIAQGLLDLVGIDANLDSIRRKIFEAIDRWKPILYEQGAAIVQRIGDGITAFLASPQDAIRGVISSAQGTATELMNTFASTMNSKGTAAVNALSDGMAAAKAAALVLAAKVFKEIQDSSIADGLGDFSTRAYNIGSAAVGQLGAGATAAKAAVKAEMATLLKEIEDHGLAAGLGAFAGRMYERAKAGMADFRRGINETAPGLKTEMQAALGGVLTSITDWWAINGSKFLEKGLAMAHKLLEGIAQGAGETEQRLSTALAGIINYIISWIGTAGSQLYTNAMGIGQQVINGIGNGITSSFPTLNSALELVAGLLPQWARDVLGIGAAAASAASIGAAAFDTTAASALRPEAESTINQNRTTTNSQQVYNQFTVAGSLLGDRDTIEQIRLLNMLYATGAT